MAKSLFTKILLSAAFLYLFLFPRDIYSQNSTSPTPVNSPTSRNSIILQKQKAIENNTGLESWTNEALGSNLTSIFVGLNGTVPEEVFDSMESGEEVEDLVYVPGGAIGEINQRTAALYTPPASGIEYLAQVKDNFLGKPAYAQNGTFNQLQFLLPIWRTFRNIIYILSTLLFLVVGLMIILRVKISPQAVVTLQSAIPQIITTLILVTFSYAIAGLILDITNLIQGTFMAALFSANGKNLNEDLFESQYWHQTWLNSIWDGIQKIFVKNPTLDYSFSSLANMDAKIFRGLARRLSPRLTTGIFLGKLIGKITMGQLAGFLGGLGGAIIPAITSILVFIWSAKLFFGLLKCYLTILFKIIIAPLEIGMGGVPNSKINFSSWFTDLLANALTFPVVAIFIVLSNMIIDVFEKGAQAGNSLWMPGLIDATRLFTFPDRAYVSLGAAFGLVCLAMMSKLPDMVPDMIKNMKGPDYGKAVGESMMGVAAIPGKGFGIFSEYQKQRKNIAERKSSEAVLDRMKLSGAEGRRSVVNANADSRETPPAENTERPDM